MEPLANNIDFKLSRNAAGRLELTTHDGTVHEGVYPARAFPIAAADEGLSLLNKAGHELAWITHLSELPVEYQQLIEEELALREFMPVIQRISHVSSFVTPSTWHVETDKGNTELTLKGEHQIWRVTQTNLLITDSHGVHFIIRELDKLDKQSRRLLDRFL